MATKKGTPKKVGRASGARPPAPRAPGSSGPASPAASGQAPDGAVEALAQQAELLRHANDQLEMVREQFADLYDYAPVGYATLDEAGVIHRINLPGAAILGCARNEAIGTRLATYVRSGFRTACATFVRDAFAGTGSNTCEVALRHGKWSAGHVQLIAASASGGRDLGHAGPQVRIAMVDVTERKRAEDALRASEGRHEAVVSAMAEGVVVHAADGAIVAANTAAQRILGLTFDEIRGRAPTDPGWQTIHEDGSPFPGSEHPAQVVLRTGVAQWDVLMGIFVPGDGTRWINVRAEPLRGADGKVDGAVATFADVTAQRLREAEVRASRAQLAQVLEGGSDGFWDWDLQAGRVHFSARMSAILGGPGVATDDFVSTWPDRVAPEQREAITARLAAIQDGEVDRIDAEYRVRTTAGAWKWLRAKGRVVARGGDGKPTRLAGTVSDVTEFKEVGERLRRSETLHRAIARSVPGAAVFLADENLRIVLADGPALAQEGLRGIDLEGRLATEVRLPGAEAFDGSHFRAAFRGEASHFELSLGERIYSVEVAPVRDEQGKVFLAAASAVDVTSLKKAEAELRTRHESLAHRYELLATQSRDVIFFVRASDGRILEANQAAVASYGYSREELLSMTVRDLRPPETAPDVPRQMGAASQGNVIFETVQRRKDGTTFPVEVSSSGAEVAGEQVLVGIVRDISRRKRAERELVARRELLDAAVRDLPVGTFLVRGSDLTIQLANPTFLALAAGRGEVGRSILEVWPEVRTPLEARLKTILQSGEPAERSDQRVLLSRSPGGPVDERFFNWTLRRVRLSSEGEYGVLGTLQETTARREAEASAKETAEWLNLALESSDAGTWEWDLRTNANTWSDGMWRLHGLEPQGRLSSYEVWRSAIHEDDRNRTEWAAQNAARLGVDIHLQYRVRAPDGGERWLAARARPVQDASGHTIRYRGTVFDVTARHRAEEARKALDREKAALENEARIRAFVSSVPDASFAFFDHDLRYVFAAGASLARLGLTPEGLEGRTLSEASPPGVALVLEVPLRAAFEGTSSELDLAVDDRVHRFRIAPVTDAEGRIDRVSVVSVDITSRHEAEAALQRSEAKYRGLNESLADGFALVDPNGPILEFNEAFRAMVGYSAEELARMTYRDLTPEVWHSFEARIIEEQVLPRGHSDVYEKEYRRKDGTVFPVELRTFSLRDPDRGLLFWAIVRDISTRRHGDLALRASEARFRAIADMAPIGICEMEPSGEIRYLNASGRQIVGASSGPSGGSVWYDAVHAEDRERVARAWAEAVSSRSPFASELRFLKAGGAVTRARCLASPLGDGRPEAPRYIGVFVDVTTERALQAQVSVSARHTALGTLVGGIAHEMNNPLAATLANAGFAIEELRDLRGDLRGEKPPAPDAMVARVDDVVEALEGAQEAAQRVAGIVRQLMTLARPEAKRSRVSVAEVVEHAIGWVPHGALDDVRVDFERAPAPDVLAAAGQLEQVVASLIANAAQATRPGRPGRVTLRIGSGEGGGAWIEVADDGGGMTPDVLDRIFDPFFTTRRVGNGMGLGLAVAHAIVTAHGGSITASSEPGKGSTFRVDLPATGAAPVA
jgi:PAS domain S-box-containing protein